MNCWLFKDMKFVRPGASTILAKDPLKPNIIQETLV